jgi:integrase
MYAIYIRAWWSLCERQQRPIDDLELLRGWLSGMASGPHAWSPSTLRVALAAISSLWTAIGRAEPLADGPTRQWFLRTLMRRIAVPPRRKAPVLRPDLARAIDTARRHAADPHPYQRLAGLRDHALLLLGWSCALRRSELAAIEVGHLAVGADGGWTLLIPASKTDRRRQGQQIPLYPSRQAHLDPVRAVQSWCRAADIRSGPVFRRISRQGAVAERGLDPASVGWILKGYDLGRDVSAHSLRSGFVTQARLDDVATHRIKVVTRHRSDRMIDVYTRQIDIRRQGPGPLL